MKNETKDYKLQDLLTELDPPYESKEELKIGHMLDQYGIPFFYRQPTVIYNDGKNEIWNPSFTLPQYGCSVIDYIAQEKQATERINIYRYNQIPATVLGPKDLDRPNWQRSLYEKIQQELQQTYNLSPYREPQGQTTIQ